MIKILNIFMSAEKIIHKCFLQQIFVRYRCHIISGIRIGIGDPVCISLCDPAFCTAVFHILQDLAHHSFWHGFSPDHLIFIIVPDNTAIFHDSPFHTPEHRKLLGNQLSGPSGCRHHIMSVIDQTLQNIFVPLRNLILTVQKSSVHIHCNDIFFHKFLLFVFSSQAKSASALHPDILWQYRYAQILIPAVCKADAFLPLYYIYNSSGITGSSS